MMMGCEPSNRLLIMETASWVCWEVEEVVAEGQKGRWDASCMGADGKKRWYSGRKSFGHNE